MSGSLGIATLLTEVDLRGLQRGLAQGQQQTQSLTTKIGQAANVAFAAATAAAAAFVVDSVAEFQTFERGMAEVFSIMPGVTEQAMSQMSDDVLSFAQEVGRTSDEVVPALYQALSSGVPASNVFDFMKIASDAALGGVTTLETAVNGITSAVNAYGAETLSAQEASDLMFTATVGGKTTFEELSQSLYNVIPTAASLGLEFGNVTAALAAVTAQGTPTSVATTQLRQLLVELSKEGGKAADTFEQMAGQSFVDFVASGGNLQEALQLMEQAAADGNVRLSDLFSSVEAGNAALSLTGAGANKFSAELDAAANSAGATADAAAMMADTGAQAIAELQSAFEALKITVGEQLAPTVTSFAEKATEQLNLMSSTSKLNEMAADLRGMGLSMSQVNDIIGDGAAQFDLWRTAADMEDDLARNEIGMRRMEIAAMGLEMGLSDVSEVTPSVANGFQESASELDNFIFLMEQMTSDIPVVTTGMEYWTLAAQEVTTSTLEQTEAVEEQIETLSLHEQQLALVASGEREMTFTTQAAVTAGQIASETHREQAEALAETTAAFASYFVAATQATDAVGFFSTTTTEAGAVLVDATINQSSLNQAMYDAAVQGGATAEQLAILGLATGVLSEEQAEAALKSAILQASVTGLAAAYVAGDLSIGDLRVEMAGLIADVNAMDVEIGASSGEVSIFAGAVAGAGEELVTAADRARGFRDAADEAAGNYSIHFDITQSGSIPNVGGDGGAAHGGNQPGFLLGGYTGDGRADEIAGFVHANEFVMPPEAVKAVGIPFLESVRQGQVEPSQEFDFAALDIGPMRRRPASDSPADDRGGMTLVVDLRGATIMNQAEMTKWIDEAVLRHGQITDRRIRTR